MDSHKRVDLATRIFAEHGTAIRAMIRRHVTCRKDEDEVYQNLYLSLVCNPVPATVTNLPAYLNTVIRNDMIDAIRQRKCRQEMVSRYAMHQTRSEMERAPDERVTQTEEVQRITGLVARLLPDREATAVIERYVYGYSLADIAMHMQVKPRTAARYICVGLKRVREAIFRRGL
ncbi:MAG: sigma-70 family RNA polymerase sigma factor [Planctomycetes bacterium]|nr:sigma-70 family RNA polymerase sigma factor [Planctomycetota bacterium]